MRRIKVFMVLIVPHPRLVRVRYERRRRGWFWVYERPKGAMLHYESGPYRTFASVQCRMAEKEQEMIAKIEAKQLAFGHPVLCELRPLPPAAAFAHGPILLKLRRRARVRHGD